MRIPAPVARLPSSFFSKTEISPASYRVSNKVRELAAHAGGPESPNSHESAERRCSRKSDGSFPLCRTFRSRYVGKAFLKARMAFPLCRRVRLASDWQRWIESILRAPLQRTFKSIGKLSKAKSDRGALDNPWRATRHFGNGPTIMSRLTWDRAGPGRRPLHLAEGIGIARDGEAGMGGSRAQGILIRRGWTGM